MRIVFAALSHLQPAERWRQVTEALSADEMSALYQKMQANPALYGDEVHRLMHTAQQAEGRAANLFTRLCAAETAIDHLQRTRTVMEPAPVRFDFEADNLRQQLDGLRRAYEHACAQRDKYMRRTAEWRSAALDGTAVTTACTGCGQCDYCQRKAADDAEG
jgi:hypothetical protein